MTTCSNNNENKGAPTSNHSWASLETLRPLPASHPLPRTRVSFPREQLTAVLDRLTRCFTTELSIPTVAYRTDGLSATCRTGGQGVTFAVTLWQSRQDSDTVWLEVRRCAGKAMTFEYRYARPILEAAVRNDDGRQQQEKNHRSQLEQKPAKKATASSFVPQKLGMAQGDSAAPRAPFPLKLYQMLNEVENEGQNHIVSWQPSGRSFKVHKPKEFEKALLPRWFQVNRFVSFERKLMWGYGFKRMRTGPEKGAYHHEYFLHDQPHLANRIHHRTQATAAGPAHGNLPNQQPQSTNRPRAARRCSTDTADLVHPLAAFQILPSAKKERLTYVSKLRENYQLWIHSPSAGRFDAGKLSLFERLLQDTSQRLDHMGTDPLEEQIIQFFFVQLRHEWNEFMIPAFVCLQLKADDVSTLTEQWFGGIPDAAMMREAFLHGCADEILDRFRRFL